MYQVVNDIENQHIPTTAFLGMNLNEELSAGENHITYNWCNDDYPVLRTRKPSIRTEAHIEAHAQGALLKKSLAVVRDGYLYWAGGVTPVNSVPFTSGDKQLVSMGAYLIVFPDGYYFNTEKPTDKGYIERRFNTDGSTVTFQLCKQDGSAYGTPAVSNIAPDNPANGDLWIDTTENPHILKQWAETSSMWVVIPTVYLKIGSTGIGQGLKMYDSVEISGIEAAGNPYQAQLTFLNGTMIVYDCGDDYIVVAGIVDGATSITDNVHVDMTMPPMDYVCESNNRLWGCKYGIVNGEPLNEIYACKLGDFRNWRSYMGLSTDSYTVSLGTDGEFTGAVNYLGYPIFFKENAIHKIYGTAPANYQVQTTTARGVEKGSWRSLCVIDEILYYKSAVDIVAYDGSLPARISDALGDAKFKDAVFGNGNGKLYCFMTMERGKAIASDDGTVCMVYDPRLRTWNGVGYGKTVFCGSSSGDIIRVDGAACVYLLNPNGGEEGEPEPTVTSKLVTGRMAYGDAKNTMKLLKVTLRMRIEKGANLKVYTNYDSDDVNGFKLVREFHAKKLGTYVLPIFIRKCDSVRLGFIGEGDISIFGLTQVYTEGANR